MRLSISWPCEPSRDEADAGDVDPRGGARDGFLEVLGEPPVAVEPGESALDDPAFWQKFEAFDVARALDDFDGPPAELL